MKTDLSVVIVGAGLEEFWRAGPTYPLVYRLLLPLIEDRAHSSVVPDGDLCRYRGSGDRDAYRAGIFHAGERDDANAHLAGGNHRLIRALLARLPDKSARLLAGLTSSITDARAFDHPRAIAYWPVDRARSRFDAQAAALRVPPGGVHFGGDTPECTHSDGAVRSAQRMVAAGAGRLGIAMGVRA